MAAANVLTTGTSTTPSSPITITANTTQQFILKDADGGTIGFRACVYYEVQDDAGQYTTMLEALTNDNPGFGITAGANDIVIRWKRAPDSAPCGVTRL